MTIEQHMRERQIELGRSIESRRKIYLDARFWIFVRDTALGSRTDFASQELLRHLRRGVASGLLVCPISASMFCELMKQAYSPGRRIGTAQLIDELSMGVSMISPPILVGTELHSFLLRAKGDVDLYPVQELIWTKAAYTLGDTYPSLPHLSPTEELTIQKVFCDHLWDYSLSDMVKTIGDDVPPPDGFVELSLNTNEKNVHYKDELRSFAQTYDIELRGAIELAGDVTADVICWLAENEARCKLSCTPDERAASVNMCRNLLYHAFKRSDTRNALRSIHIGASIHAAMRWNKTRKFKPNDYYDFQHATAALSYCDAFLTEISLHNLVTQSQINLDAVNDCRVFSDIQTAADYIGQLSTKA